MMALITAWEVIRYSPASDKFPPGEVEPHIFQTEFAFARKYFGITLYNVLVAALVDYGKPDEWDATATYDADDIVVYFGSVLKSLVGSNTTNPCEDDGTKWAVAEKFSTACYEDLWNIHLRDYLAFLVMSTALDYSTYKITAKGAIEFFDDESGIRTAGYKSFSNLKTKLIHDAEERLENMKCYMEDSSCDFSDALFLCDDTKTFRRRTRRFIFKH